MGYTSEQNLLQMFVLQQVNILLNNRIIKNLFYLSKTYLFDHGRSKCKKLQKLEHVSLFCYVNECCKYNKYR